MKLIVLFLIFLKFGCLCIGGGNVLVPLYVDELVERRELMTSSEFANLLAITQITPGPVGVNGATFFGYRAAKIPGAIVATIGLLAPSFIFMMLALHYLAKWRSSKLVQGLLWGVAPASIALIITAFAIFAEMSILTGPVPWKDLLPFLSGAGDVAADLPRVRPLAVLICAASTYALTRTKVQITTLILLSAVIGAVTFPFLGA